MFSPYLIIQQKNQHENYLITYLVKLTCLILKLFDFCEGKMPKLIHHHSKKKKIYYYIYTILPMSS